MSNRLIISESEKQNIRSLYGLITEQKTGFQVPKLAQDAVGAIEHKFGKYDSKGIQPLSWNGDEKVTWMEDYVNSTIGLKCWNNMSDKMKAQIYSQVFQADGGDKPMQFLFIAALASCIDPNIQRTSVSRKDMNSPAVKNAIQLIKNNCATINDHYDCLMNTIISQYRGTIVSDYNAEKIKYLWVPRPIAIDSIMNGTSISKALEEWEVSVGIKKPNTQVKTKEQPKQETKKGVTISVSGNDLNDLNQNFKKFISARLKEDYGKMKIDKVTFDQSDKIKVFVTFSPSEDGYDYYSILFNPKGGSKESLNRAKNANPGLEVVYSGEETFINDQGQNERYQYDIVGIPRQ